MLPVEVVPLPGGTLVLRARGSELLILPQHTAVLKGYKTPKEFAGYFLQEALLNRPARKLFEAWLRKDKDLWRRIYTSIQNDVEVDEKLVADNDGANESEMKSESLVKPARTADRDQHDSPAVSHPAKKAGRAELTESHAAVAKPEKARPASPAESAGKAGQEKERKPAKKVAKKAAAKSPSAKPAKKKSSSSAKKSSAKKKS